MSELKDAATPSAVEAWVGDGGGFLRGDTSHLGRRGFRAGGLCFLGGVLVRCSAHLELVAHVAREHAQRRRSGRRVVVEDVIPQLQVEALLRRQRREPSPCHCC